MLGIRGCRLSSCLHTAGQDDVAGMLSDHDSEESQDEYFLDDEDAAATSAEPLSRALEIWRNAKPALATRA